MVEALEARDGARLGAILRAHIADKGHVVLERRHGRPERHAPG